MYLRGLVIELLPLPFAAEAVLCESYSTLPGVPPQGSAEGGAGGERKAEGGRGCVLSVCSS